MDIMEGQETDTAITAKSPSAGPSSTAETDTVSHLLRIPAEIRLSIYRYLLLPQTSISLEEVAERHKNNSIQADEDGWIDDETDSEDDWSASCDCSTCGIERAMLNDMADDMEHDFHSGCICGQCDEDDSSDTEWDDLSTDYSIDFDGPAAKMHFEILRVNRQIYQEASALFYSEVQLVLGMDDILCLMHPKLPRHYPAALFEMYNLDPPTNVIWRHDPLKGIGKQDKNGIVKYKSSRLAGRLDPHVFARFQKLQFELCYDEDYVVQEDEIWVDDDTFELNQAQAEEYARNIQQSSLIKDIVKIIAHSHNITHLSIRLEAEIPAVSLAIKRADELDDMDMDSDADEVDDEERQAIEDRSDKTQYVANERAAELLVVSELFNPLLKLSNVKNFSFAFDFIHHEPDDPPFQPQPQTVEKITAMKTTIESQYTDVDWDAATSKRDAVADRVKKSTSKGKNKERKGKEHSKGKKQSKHSTDVDVMMADFFHT